MKEKSFKMLARAFFLYALITSLSHISAQNGRIIDSLRSILKTEKEDTNKVNNLNAISVKLWRTGKYDTSYAFALKARKLSEKLGFERGVAAANSSIGIIYTQEGNSAKAIEYDSVALAIYQKMGSKSDIASILSNIGVVYDENGDYTKALKYYLNSLAIKQQISDKRGIATSQANIGLLYWNQGNYPEALEYYFKSLTIDNEIGNKSGSAINLGNIGLVYWRQENYAKGLEYYFKALTILQETGDKSGIARNYGNIGNIYKDQGEYSKALEYDFKALGIFQEIGDKNGIGHNLGNIGIIYDEQAVALKRRKDFVASDSLYKKALEYYAKAIIIFRETGNKRSLAINMGNLGHTYLIEKNYKLAKIFLDSALTLSRNIGDKDDTKETYKALSNFDSATGNYKQALEDYKKYIIYSDSILNEANTKKTVQAEMNYQFEQQQAKEKAEQDKKDAIAEQERNKQKVIRNSFIGGFALMFALAFFIFRGYRQKQKANIIITEQKEEVEKQKVLVEHQKALVEEKNKDILDSILYAKRLQDAILPPLSIIKQYLPESFVMYKPKDIVAGDFYWMERAGGNILIAAADCTGHGVPGALVSVVCSNALNRTVKEFQITEPGRILDKVRELVLETFEKSEDNVQDGMDISLCCINTKTNEVQWSGAYNPLWYMHNNELIEVPADKQPIGKYENLRSFRTHTVNLKKGDTLYLFTDGFADQFGGTKGKKFKYKQLQEKLLAISHQPLAQQKEELEREFEEWKGQLEQVDDVLVIGIRV